MTLLATFTGSYEANVAPMTEAEKVGYHLACTIGNASLATLNEQCEKAYSEQAQRREMWQGFFFKREGWVKFRKEDCPF